MDHKAKVTLLKAAYKAFNERDIESALELMHEDVSWPRAFLGGYVKGPKAVGQYWADQWKKINPHVEPLNFQPDGEQILTEIHQVVRDLDGELQADEEVGHKYTFKNGLIYKMDICEL